MFLTRLLTASALLLCSVVLLPAQSPVPLSPAMRARVDAMIAKMSVDDKLKLIGGVDGFYTQAIPSIALKRLKMSDGPVGVRTFGLAPAYTRESRWLRRGIQRWPNASARPLVTTLVHVALTSCWPLA
jgi:beta-glucosidase